MANQDETVMKRTLENKDSLLFFRRKVYVIALALCLALSACATSHEDPNPPITHSERMSLQNECVKIADRSERERCLEQAAFRETH